jgi:hypothetical protein
MTVDIGWLTVLRLTTKAAWAALSDEQRRQFLEDKRAALAEYQLPPNGVIWTNGQSNNEGDVLVMVWNLVDDLAFRALVTVIAADDVTQYFTIGYYGGNVATDQEQIWTPFLRT